MGVVSSAGRFPAKQLIRESKRIEKELVHSIMPSIDAWPELFHGMGGFLTKVGRHMSPIKLANLIDQAAERFEVAVHKDGSQYGQFWGRRFGKRTTYREGVVMSYGHPLIDEDGISLWNVVMMCDRQGLTFSSTARSNISEHALGRWIERSPTELPIHAVGQGLVDGARMLHFVNWDAMRIDNNEFNMPLGNIILSGLIRGVVPMSNKRATPAYLFDIRTAFTKDYLNSEQLLQAGMIDYTLRQNPTINPLLYAIDTGKPGPIPGCTVPAGRPDYVRQRFEAQGGTTNDPA